MTIWLYFTLDVLVDSVILIIASASPLNASCRVVSCHIVLTMKRRRSIRSSHPLPWKLSLQTVISFLIISYWIHDERINKSHSIQHKPTTIQLLYFHKSPSWSSFFRELVSINTRAKLPGNLIATADIVPILIAHVNILR